MFLLFAFSGIGGGVVFCACVCWILCGYGGAMAVLCGGFFEKTPPNSGGVAGFKWRCHGGRRRLNDGGRMAVMMEETFF